MPSRSSKDEGALSGIAAVTSIEKILPSGPAILQGPRVSFNVRLSPGGRLAGSVSTGAGGPRAVSANRLMVPECVANRPEFWIAPAGSLINTKRLLVTDARLVGV